MTRFWTDSVQTIFGLRKVEDTESGFILESKDGKIKFEDRHHRLLAPHLTDQATFSDDPGAALQYNGIEVLNAGDTIQIQAASAGLTIIASGGEAT
jgi:hypothetical protein